MPLPDGLRHVKLRMQRLRPQAGPFFLILLNHLDPGGFGCLCFSLLPLFHQPLHDGAVYHPRRELDCHSAHDA